MLFLVRLLAFMLWLLVAGTAQAQSAIVQSSYLEDINSTLTWEDARELTYIPFTGALTRGYTTSTYWIKLHIDPGLLPTPVRFASTDSNDLLLRIMPTYIDAIALYDPLQPGTVQRSGDMTPASNDPYRSLHFNFVLPRGDEPRDIWLQVQSTSSMHVIPQIFTIPAALELDRMHFLFSGLILGLLTVIALWAVLLFIAEPEKLTLAFSFKQLVVLAHSFAYLGYWRLLLSDSVAPEQLNHAFNFVVFTMTFSAVWFFYLFIREYQPSKVGLALLRYALYSYPFMLLAQALGRVQLALEWVSYLALFVPLLLLPMGFTAKAWREKNVTDSDSLLLSKWQLMTLLASFFIILWLYVLPVKGLASLPHFAIYGILFYNLLTSAIMVAILQVRARKRLRRQAQQAEELKQAQQQVELEKNYRADQEKLMTMLAHELKTPLAVIKMRASTDDADGNVIHQSVDEMRNVIDRCIQAGQLLDNQLQPEKHSCIVPELVSEALAALHLQHPVNQDFAPVPSVVSDSNLLHIIIRNLLDNANKYAAPNTPIDISLRTVGQATQQAVELVVANAPGKAGWPKPEEVFNKYYRTPAAQRVTGSGLGLFLVKGLAQIIGASVDYAPSVTQLRFVLRIPITQ